MKRSIGKSVNTFANAAKRLPVVVPDVRCRASDASAKSFTANFRRLVDERMQ